MKGKVALITGGTKGIGLGIAHSLLELGVKVAITGRKQEDCDRVAKSLSEQYNTDVMGVSCDVRNYDSQVACADKVAHAWGGIDYVIANAGLGVFKSVQDISIEEWNDVIETNLTGVFYTTKATFSHLKNSHGYLITIASLAGTNFFAQGSAYNASKFGVVGYTQAAMLDLRSHDIKVTTIMPGSVATHFNGNVPDDTDAWKIQPEDIGKLVVDLIQMHPRTLPSKIEVRPSRPDKK